MGPGATGPLARNRGTEAVRAETERRRTRVPGPPVETPKVVRAPTDLGATNLHLGARDPEPGKRREFFANPWAIDFKHRANQGYVVSAASNVVAKSVVIACAAMYTGREMPCLRAKSSLHRTAAAAPQVGGQHW